MSPAARARRGEMLALLSEGDGGVPLIERVCEVAARLLEVSGAGMCLIGARSHQIIVHGTDRLAEELEDLQISLGQGPCVETVRTGAEVLVPELRGYESATWPAYAEQALARGVRAVFTFPLQAATIQLGALDLYRVDPGPMTGRQVLDARALTDIATRSMFALEDKIHYDSRIAALNWQHISGLPPVARGRAADLGITVDHALALLRPGRTADVSARSA